MGLFDSLDDSVKLSGGRQNDKAGRYWQRIDSIQLLTSRKKVEYIKISKTTIKVFEGELAVGEETNEALFRDENNFLEKDLKRLAQTIYSLTMEEADALTGVQLKTMLVDSTDPVGEVIEISVKEIITKADKVFAKTRWSHRVTPMQLEEGLDEATKGQFFPQGVLA